MTARPVAAPSSRRTLIAAALGLVVVVAIGLALALGGSDDDGGDADGATGSRQPSFGPVVVDGAPLARFTSTSDDPAAGRPAPLVAGQDADGSAVTVGGSGRPTVIAFLAHWCPHCQRELPSLVELMKEKQLDGVRMVALLTGTNADAPNYPPMAWLDREGWAGEVLLDDEASSAAASFGLSGYPFLVFLDGDGTVVARASGELPDQDILALVALTR